MKIAAVLVALSVSASGQALSQEARDENSPEPSAEAPQAAQVLRPAVSKEETENLSGAMFGAYLEGGAGSMLKLEEMCWSFLRKNRQYAVESGLAKCAIMSMSGAFIEASYARAQRRLIAPAYSTQGFRERIFTRAKSFGWSSERTQSMLTTSVATNQEGVISGLMNAGMR